MKKLFFLVLFFIATSYECYGMQQQEFDPVKTVLIAAYTSIAPVVQDYSNQLLTGGTVVATAVWASIAAKNWYISSQEIAQLYEELQQTAGADVHTALDSNDETITSTANQFYYDQYLKLGDEQLNNIVDNFNAKFHACLVNKTRENKEELWTARVSLSTRILELTL